MPSIFLHVDGCRKIIDKKEFFNRNPNAKTLALVGSVIPDLELFGIIGKVHGRSKEFYDYLEKKDKEYLPLAFGMIVHEHHDNIIETHFVEDNEKEARKLLAQYDPEISKIGAAPELLIEYSLDCSLIEEKPELIDFTTSIAKKIKRKQIKKISSHLADFFGGDRKAIYRALRIFKKFKFSIYASSKKQHSLLQRYLFLVSQNKELNKKGFKGKIVSVKFKLAMNYLYGKKLFTEKKGDIRKIFLKAKKKFSHSTLFKHVKINEEVLSKLPFKLL